NEDIPSNQIVDASVFNQMPREYNMNNEYVRDTLIRLFDSDVTRWLISSVKIEKELYNIKSHQNISFYFEEVLQLINLYICSKIVSEIMSRLYQSKFDTEP